MRRFFLLCTLLAGLLVPAAATAQQDPVLVTKNFRFQDGVYLSHQSFRANTPDLGWEEVEATWYTNPQTFLTQLEDLRPKNKKTGIKPDSIWGFCLQGIPYLRLSRDWIQKELATFAPLQLRGKICYFEFDRIDTAQVLITAYNPANGLPFRQGLIEKELEVNCPKILDFESGEVADFTRDNLIAWIADDPELAKAVQALTEEEAKTKLFKSLLIYVDRNQVYISEE